MISKVRLLPLILAASCAGVPGVIAQADAQSAAVPANGVGTAFELAFWQSISASTDPAMFAAYLEQYPGGTFASLARAKIAASRRAEPAAPVSVAVVGTIAVAGQAAPVAAPAAVPPAAAPLAPVVPAPAVVPTPVAAAPAAPEPAMKLIPAMVAPFAVRPPEPAPAATRPASVLADPALLAALAQSQIAGAAAAPESGPALPARPVLAAVPTLDVPDHFCSAVARNQYHDAVYKPAMALASANNASAVRYLQALDAQYRAFGAQSDAAGMNAVAAGSRAYQPVASEAFATSSAYLRLFDRIMAAPVRGCR